MPKHQQLVTSLGATVVVADAENDFLIAEHDADDSPLETSENEPVKRQETKDFGSAVKSLLTSTTCHKY